MYMYTYAHHALVRSENAAEFYLVERPVDVISAISAYVMALIGRAACIGVCDSSVL